MKNNILRITHAWLQVLIVVACCALGNGLQAGPRQASQPRKIGRSVAAPEIVFRKDAEYSEAAQRNHISGSVILEIVVQTDGKAAAVRIVKGLGYGLDEAAADAIKDWVFRPATESGAPIPVKLNVEFVFNVETSPAIQAEAPEFPASVRKVGNSVTAPKVISTLEPKYSKLAERRNITGKVVLAAVIQEDGTVKVHRVLQGLGHGLDEAAMDAVTKWKFNPAMENGSPVAVSLNLEVDFYLRKGSGSTIYALGRPRP